MSEELKLEIPGLYIICAQQGSGKSHLIDYIMHQMRHIFDYGIIMCTTAWEGSFPYMPTIDNQVFVHTDYDEKAVKSLMRIQEKLRKQHIYKEAFLILDDCIDGEKQWSSRTLKELCNTLRHYHITVIISTQYINVLPPRFRSNCHGVFIFRSTNESQLLSMYKSFGQDFERYADFKDYVMLFTGDYKFIYYSRDESGITDFKIMRCPKKIPEFKLKFNTQIIR